MEAIKLVKPYVFEGVEYTEIKAEGLERLTVQDAIEAQMAVQDQPGAALLPERSTAYMTQLLAKAAELPIEFFKLLPLRETRRVRAAVGVLLAGRDDGDTGMVMKLHAPYTWKGKEYTEVDMSGAAQLTAMDVQQAENELAIAGHIVTEPALDYLYCCCMAARASGLDRAFFTGLPLDEAAHLKNVLNSDRFFG